MKCDRRWWNDGQLEREYAAREDVLTLAAPTREHEINEANAEIRARMEECWRKLMGGDPNGQPWHEVLAAWAPEAGGSRSFFAEPAWRDQTALRDQIICGDEQLLMRALERAGAKRADGPTRAFGGFTIVEDRCCPRNRAALIDHQGGVTWFALADVDKEGQ